jgi:hypothetical protein
VQFIGDVFPALWVIIFYCGVFSYTVGMRSVAAMLFAISAMTYIWPHV